MSAGYYKKLQIEVEAHKMSKRLAASFAKAKQENRGILGIFVSAGDPDTNTSIKILDGLVESGVDMIELGMPFSDPMADGPAIQAASLRAIKSGMTLRGSLEIASQFRKKHADTPLILMGYYNPIYRYGVELFLKDAQAAGADGLIIVDLPPEEDVELCNPSQNSELDFIRLITPTTLGDRLPHVLEKASGFIYYVSIAGITGTKSAQMESISSAVNRIKQVSDLPVVTGFGIRTAEQAAHIASLGDGAIVGSAVVEIIAESDTQNLLAEDTARKVSDFTKLLADAISAHKPE
jgi:tryptophan synthase alpha chain